VRPADMFARFGGEEFVMTFTNVPHEDVRASIERIRLIAESTTVRHNGAALRCTVSIGAAPYAPGGSIETLFEEADAALYRAKAKGRNRAAFSKDPEMIEA
jgi:diguanylate cyclase (GGDEF)-like protein